MNGTTFSSVGDDQQIEEYGEKSVLLYKIQQGEEESDREVKQQGRKEQAGGREGGTIEEWKDTLSIVNKVVTIRRDNVTTPRKEYID